MCEFWNRKGTDNTRAIESAETLFIILDLTYLKVMNQSSNRPRILIIANTSLSSTRNEGKTIASFFQGYPKNKIRQLYFNNEYPDTDVCQSYYRVTDFDIIRSFRKTAIGMVLEVTNVQQELPDDDRVPNVHFWKILKIDLIRLLRELAWRIGKWKTNQLVNWLDDFAPELVFFCAGDSGFAYRINDYVVTRYKCRSVVYLTDDYILPRHTISPFWWIRRYYIYEKMKVAIRNCDQFLTISDKMRNIYRDIFKKDSIVALNIPQKRTFKLRPMGGASHNDNIVLVYAGGLHYKRYKTLRLLALAIRKFNLSPEVERKAQLRIYCNQKPTERERRAIELQGASNYCGALSSEELSDVLARSDILVHVESFDYNSIDKTRLSVSTKISEYMSLGKPILAIGPENIASMEVLSDVAFCITDTKQLNQKVSEFLLDDLLPASLALKALEMYEAKYLIANYDQYLLQMILGSSDTYQALEKQ